MICSLDELTPQARAAAQSYLDGVAPTIDAEFRDVVLCDLRAYLGDHLDADATPADVRAVLDRTGPVPDAADAAPGDASPRGTAPHGTARNATASHGASPDPADPRVGSLGGVPFDLRPPTAERVLGNLWNPLDERVFVPRSVGAGWDLNFGALAVRLGLIEPDAEDVPFESVPPHALRAALALPAALSVAVAAHYLVRGRSLPARLPSHFDALGRPDRWVSKPVAAATDVALAVAPAAWAAWSVASGRPRVRTVGAIALAAASSGAAAVLTVTRSVAVDARPRPWVGPATLAALLAPLGGTLLALARAGRAAEVRRDLGGAER